MRYRVRLQKALRNNFVLLPQNSPLRQALVSKSAYQQFNTSNVSPIKISPIAGGAEYFLGFAGGTSQEDNTIEISDKLGRLLGL